MEHSAGRAPLHGQEPHPDGRGGPPAASRRRPPQCLWRRSRRRLVAERQHHCKREALATCQCALCSVLWRHPWSQWVRDLLLSSSNPQGTISNSDLEMAGGLLHLDCAAQTFDVQERTILRVEVITSTLPSGRGRGTPPPTPCQPTCCA